jgi:hypothetical protein
MNFWKAPRALPLAARALVFLSLAAGVCLPSNGGQSQPLGLLANAPLYFEANLGQVESPVQFVARGRDCSVWLAPTEAALVLAGGVQPKSTLPPPRGAWRSTRQDVLARVVRLRLQNANPSATMTGANALTGKANYLVGNDPAGWHTAIPLFSRVEVDEIYPGVRMVYHADAAARLEYDFILQPNARPETISFRIDGADRVQVDGSGNLVLKIGADEIVQHRPIFYQDVRGIRRYLAGGYRVTDGSLVSFRVAEYDRRLPLVIDPTLAFSTYLGGSAVDVGWSIALDPAGNIYIAGETLSKMKLTNVFQTNYNGGTKVFGDAFVAKYDNSGSNLIYLTYLGGKRDDGALGVAADASGNAYVTGYTDSLNFPVTNTVIRNTITGQSNNAIHVPPVDAFVTKLNPSGTALIFSTFLGGRARDEGVGIALDASSIYVAGFTESPTNFVPAPNGFQTNFGGSSAAFVVKINQDGTTNGYYCTYLGGGEDYAESVAVDLANGNAWVTGVASSTTFPTTANALTLNGVTLTNLNLGVTNKKTTAADAFISELSSDGATLLFSSYLGGSNDDVGMHVTVDSSGNAYVAGFTQSPDFPTNVITLPPSPATNFGTHAFIVEITPGGGANFLSSRIGGSRSDIATGVAVDASGLVYVTGTSSSTNFFATNAFSNFVGTNAPNKRSKDTNDVFIAVLNPGLASYDTNRCLRFGGPGNDQGNGIAVDPSGGAVYVVGQTTSTTNFPLLNAHQTSLGGVRNSKVSDAFVTKFTFP